ncbi:hypothetical protein QLX08_009495 [Tetragonisca angustula]|uniref:RNase H type-1 domain-containing protein n=1 Tax=Tetragonisca angustula TaxID=166442 RepID=A0AAW0ZIB3_9HYME
MAYSCDNNRVVFMWIPSHCCIKENELADKLAKKAAQRVHDPRFGVSCSDFEEIVQEKNVGKHNKFIGNRILY